MGYPYNGLIPAAILLENPGITREEFVQLLDKTHSSSIGTCKKRSRWDSSGGCDDYIFHEGLHGLAGILILGLKDQFKDLNKEILDKNGLLIDPPIFFVCPYKKKSKWMPPEFEVIVHEKNVLFDNIEGIECPSYDKLGEGDVWERDDITFQLGVSIEKGIVRKIIEEEMLKINGREDGTDSLEEQFKYKYKMLLQPFDEIKRRQIFSSLQELVERWPQFDPNFMYNFSKNNGSFSTMVSDSGEGFRWMQKDNKYYLDEEYTFNHIPAGFGNFKFGYTDLILTAEAIKNEAWRLLTYRGRDNLDYFFKKFPESYNRYKRAVWDSHTSLYAKHKGLSISDFLRLRMNGD